MADYDWSEGGKGALGGAMAGASAGSMIMPGWGTAIGGVIGGGLGLLGGFGNDDPNQQYKDQLEALSRGYSNRAAPQVGPAGSAAYSGFRRNQAGLVAQLEAMARGEGPSAAQIQMREAMDRAAAAQSSAAAGAGGRGVNAGAALRQAANNTAAIQAQGARDTATLRAQEQFNALNQLGQSVAQGRAADEGINQFNTAQGNQFQLANLQAKLQMIGLNDEAQLRAVLGLLGAPQPGPGMGTQLLAGGASMVPTAVQYKQGQDQMAMQQQYMDWLKSKEGSDGWGQDALMQPNFG